MRIAFFVSRFPNPSETWIVAQVEGVLARGADVDVVALAEGDAARAAELKAKWGDRLSIYTVPVGKSVLARLIELPGALGDAPAGAADTKRFGEDAWSLRLPIAAAHWPDALNAPRIWLAHYGRWGRFACALRDLGLIAGPIATMFHGRDMSVYLRKRPDAYRTLFRRGDLFLPISDLWRAILISLGAPDQRTMTHRMGVDVSRFAYTPRTLAVGEKVRFIGVGRFVEKKGFNDAIAAFARLGAVNAELTLIGDGALRPKLEERARGLAVRFTGTLANAAVAEELRCAHVFVLASKTARDGDMEGVPVALMEAMAQGLPVVSTRHSGIQELVEPGISGLLGDEGDVAALAANMARMVQEAERWPAMGEAGAKRVREEFNVDTWNDLLMERLAAMSATPRVG